MFPIWLCVTAESLRSDRLEQFWRGFHRCGSALPSILPGLRTPTMRRKPAQPTLSALKDAQGSGTGHSRLSLLCRVLAEGESAPSARKWGFAVNFEMYPPENAQTCPKRDPERSCGCGGAHCRPGRSGGLRGGASAVAGEARAARRRVQPCRLPLSAGDPRR